MPTQRCPVCEREFYHHHGGRHTRVCCSEACLRQFNEAKYVVKRTLSVADAAYLAGLVDGEGTLSLWRCRRAGNRSGFQYQITFTISQASHPFLEEIRQMVGNGRIGRSNPNKSAPQHKACFVLVFGNHPTRWVLPQLMPYLRRKRRQAEVVLKYFATLEVASRRNTAGHEERAALYAECHDLNRRGLPEA